MWADRDGEGVVDDLMDYDQAKDWYAFYRDRSLLSVGADTNPAADIHENATADFLEYARHAR